MRGLIGASAGPAWSAAATLAAPGLRLMLRRRVGRGKEDPARLPEREGVDPAPRPPGRLVWLHAASVGETQSLLPVLDALGRLAPDTTCLVTTGTLTSARLLAQRRPATLHRFIPLDVPRWVARFLDHWRPDAGAFVESELWPNLLAACRSRHVPLVLLNGRLSPASAAGWARAPGFAREVFGTFEAVLARSDADRARFAALGARQVSAPGDLKFAADPLPCDEAELARLRAELGGRPAWLAAATHPGEEDLAASVHARLAPEFPGLVTVVAPRHPERGPGLGHPCRSAGAGPSPGIWVADTLGEFGLLFRLAPVVFMGKSLTGQGGQNPLEPARLGCAVAAGPHMENFAEATEALEAARALARVRDVETLAAWVATMLRDPAGRQAMGARAHDAASGASDLPERAASLLLRLAR